MPDPGHMPPDRVPNKSGGCRFIPAPLSLSHTLQERTGGEGDGAGEAARYPAEAGDWPICHGASSNLMNGLPALGMGGGGDKREAVLPAVPSCDRRHGGSLAFAHLMKNGRSH